ncbi:MAG: hypothetical protein HQK83_09745 [Fibrobacteria bacterium]|nr:hypothetical protein [Fibrobacteria bacterium]
MPDLAKRFFLINLHGILLFTCLFIPLLSSAFQADISDCQTGLEFNGTPSIRVGDKLHLQPFTAEGMIEVRNESRFNQSLFPNHNWRGIVNISHQLYPIPYTSKEKKPYWISLALHHESAHPTMGIEETPKHAFEKIYDGSYRRYQLNRLVISPSAHIHSFGLSHFMKTEYQFYFLSKNTPELSSLETATGHGLLLAYEMRKLLSTGYLFLSIYDHFIFEGIHNTESEVYIMSASNSIVVSPVRYPIINETNTLVLKAGYVIPFTKNRSCSFYVKYLSGCIGGFIDSRETREVFAIGIAFVPRWK